LAWHDRKADPELAQIRTSEVNTVLTSLITNHGLSILNGDKVIEVKSSSVNKGKACSHLLINQKFDSIIALGDDYTDEFMFEELPDFATTIKVGFKKTKAKYYIKDTDKVRQVLNELL
jgi:trehalose 6-phosphate synthase/phosphatase